MEKREKKEEKREEDGKMDVTEIASFFFKLPRGERREREREKRIGCVSRLRDN